jgi:glucose 1-dehydrogenase
MKLKGQCALVTGGDKGIGKGIALAMAREGAAVHINFHSNQEEADRTVGELQALGVKATATQGDVSDEGDVQALFDAQQRDFGRLDILVNNAGVNGKSLIADMTLEEWHHVLNTNVTSQFLCSREAVRRFRKQEHDRAISRARGKILCVSSVHDVIPAQVNYAASKGAIRMLVRSLALELAAEWIRVAGIAPGAIQTDINRQAWEDPERRERMLDNIPYRRLGQPEDIGALAAWLASDEADYITGDTIYMDGGMTLYPSFATPE